MGRKKKSSENYGSSSSSDSDSTVSEKTKTQVLPIASKKIEMPGAIKKPRRQPPWYSVRILEEERPDLADANGKINLEKDEAALMDMFIRKKSDLQTGDLIVTDDNLDEEDRKFNRYEVQLKYNEGRYTALYLISRQICADNETVEKNTLFAMKTSIRPYSVNIILRMKRELRILNELKKSKCPYSPVVLDSGRVADLPFIVMNLLDRNLEKLREQVATFKASTAYYIAHEALSAIAFLHSHKYVHRDIKLTNFCIGAGALSTRVFLIDYGDTVKQGKKIKYGTPDVYTLPYWSLDAHKRLAAREKGDAESWFYVLIELLHPGSLPWYQMNNERAVEAAKTKLWEGHKRISDSPYIRLIFELIQRTGGNFDHHKARRIVREAIDHYHRGSLVLEWAPNLRVNLPKLTGRRLVKPGSKLSREVERPLDMATAVERKVCRTENTMQTTEIKTEGADQKPAQKIENVVATIIPDGAPDAKPKNRQNQQNRVKQQPPQGQPLQRKVRAAVPQQKNQGRIRKSKSKSAEKPQRRKNPTPRKR